MYISTSTKNLTILSKQPIPAQNFKIFLASCSNTNCRN